jgi:hypothetical protein
MQPRVAYRSTWERVRQLGALFVPERYRNCKLCGQRFTTGIVIIEQGYSTDAICETCCREGHHEEMN